jgi:hypothetical protein
MSSLFVLTFMFSTPGFCLGVLNPNGWDWELASDRCLVRRVDGSFVRFLLGVTAPKPPQPVSSGCWPQLNVRI